MFHIFLLNPPCFHRLFPVQYHPCQRNAFFRDAVAHHEAGALGRVVLHQHRYIQLTGLGPMGKMVADGGNSWKLDKELSDDGKLEIDFLLDEWMVFGSLDWF